MWHHCSSALGSSVTARTHCGCFAAGQLDPFQCLLQGAVHKFMLDLKSKHYLVSSDHLHGVGSTLEAIYEGIIICRSRGRCGHRAAHPYRVEQKSQFALVHHTIF